MCFRNSMKLFVLGGGFVLSACLVAMAHAEDKLLLADVISRTLNNPSIISKDEMTKAAQSQVDTAKWQYYPTPTISVQKAQTSTKDISYQGDSMVTNIGLQQPLWTGGKLDSGLEKAEFEQKASVFGLAEAKQDIQLRTIQSYGDWLIASTKIKAADRSIQAHQQLYNRIERRVNEGLSAESDLTLALSRLQQAQADRYSANIQRMAALAKLSQLTGEDITDDVLGVDHPKTIPDTANDAVALAVSNNPSIRKLEQLAQAALSDIDIQKSSQYPDIVAKVEQQYGNFQIKNTESDARFFLTLQSKFGAGLSTASAIQSARSKHQSALSDVEATKRTITEQTLTEWSNAKQLKKRLSVLESALISAEKISDAWDRQFISGKKSWLDVMNSARELSQTEMQIAEAMGSLLVSSWKVNVYCQTP